jgi:hypothetical protein
MSYEDPITPSVSTSRETVTDAATHAWKATTDKAGEALQSGERYVRDNPGTSVLSIFGLGFLLGLLVGWTLAHDEREEYSTRARKLGKSWGDKLNLF